MELFDCLYKLPFITVNCVLDLTTVSWYGWNFDLSDLSLKVDMRRYHPFKLRYCFSMSYEDESVVVRSLAAVVSGKFAVALFDLQCGPRPVVIQNAYELFLLCGVLLLAYYRGAQRVVRHKRCVLRLLGIVVRVLSQCVMARWEAAAALVLSELQLRALAWQALATVLCREGSRSWSSLRRGCRLAIIERAMAAVRDLEECGGHQWMVGILRDRGLRFPAEFRNCS